MKFSEMVYEAVRKIPYGKVTNYGTIAKMIGKSRSSRLVGFALHSCPDMTIPCHRVVRKSGSLSYPPEYGGYEMQKMLLNSEGITVDENFNVDMDKYGWK